MSIGFDLLWRSILFAIPAAGELSVFIGVGGWGWSSSSNMVPNIVASCLFPNNPPTSSYAADSIIFRNMLHTAWIGPSIGGVSIGNTFLFFDGKLK